MDIFKKQSQISSFWTFQACNNFLYVTKGGYASKMQVIKLKKYVQTISFSLYFPKIFFLNTQKQQTSTYRLYFVRSTHSGIN